MTARPSRTQIRKAGRRLRDLWQSDVDFDDLPKDEQAALGNAYAVVVGFRTGYAEPLLKVRMGLQSFIKTTGYPDAQVGQRLKRFPRIMDKLVRYPSMQLITMQDIGGCRVVLPDVGAVRKVQRHIEKRWAKDVVEIYDYTAAPQDSGYRAIHIVVRRDDHLIEVQLRTGRQHQWADAVEQYSRQIGTEMKWGEGGERARDAFARIADHLAVLDEGGEASIDDVLEELLGWTDMIEGPED